MMWTWALATSTLTLISTNHWRERKAVQGLVIALAGIAMTGLPIDRLLFSGYILFFAGTGLATYNMIRYLTGPDSPTKTHSDTSISPER